MNLSDTTRHYFHVWLRYQISLSKKGQYDWLVLHNLWGDDPVRNGESYTKACEQLFNFVTGQNTQIDLSIYEKEVITEYENLNIFKNMVLIFQKLNFEINIDDKGHLTKSFKHYIYDGMDDDELDSYIDDCYQDGDELQDLNITDFNDQLILEDLKEDEEKAKWTIQNILLSKELVEIVKSKKILSKLTEMLFKIINKKKSTIKSVIGTCLKKLRKLYIKWLRQTASMRIEAYKVDEFIISFTNRKLSEVKEKPVDGYI